MAHHGTSTNLSSAPDGGWGWMVVLGSFLVHVIADGVTYTFGVLAPEFLEYYSTSREMIGWLSSIMVGMTLSSGPLVSFLCNKYGNRNITFLGGFVGALGMAASYFYADLWFLCLTASVLAGLGFGLAYLPSIVLVGVYFDKMRGLAIGLAVCGAGIGTFIFSPLIEFLIDVYNWRGAMLILGGVVLNFCVCGAIYRPLKTKMNFTGETEVEEAEEIQLMKVKEVRSGSSDSDNGDPPVDGKVTRNAAICSSGEIVKRDGSSNKTAMFMSVPNMSSPTRSSRQLEQTSQDSLTKSVVNLAPSNFSNPYLVISSIQNLNHFQPASTFDAAAGSQTSKSSSSCGLLNFLKLDLLLDPVFVMFAISNFLTSLGFNAPFLYVKDRALLHDVDSRKASFLISSIGIGNTVGRIAFGILATKATVNRLQLYNATLVVCGAVIIFSSLATTYPWMVVYTMAFGLLSGTYVTLTSVVLVDLLGVERLSDSFGLTLLFQGVGVFVGPPLAGWIYDQTLSYDWSFWMCGAAIGLSGLMLYPIPFIQRRISQSQHQ